MTATRKYDGLADRQGMPTAEATELLISMRNLTDDGGVYGWRSSTGKLRAIEWYKPNGSHIYTVYGRRFFQLDEEASDVWNHRHADRGWTYFMICPASDGVAVGLAAVTRRAFVPPFMTQIYQTNPMLSQLLADLRFRRHASFRKSS